MSIGPFLREAAGCLWRERQNSRALLHRTRDHRLMRLIEHARASTVLGRERLSGVSGPEQLARIRPISKEEMSARFNESVAHGALDFRELTSFTHEAGRAGTLYRGEYMVATTSGTSGRVGYFVTDRRAWAAQNGALFARILRHRLIPSEVLRFCFGRRYRMAMTIATEGHFITRLVSEFRPLLSRALIDMQAFSVMEALTETVGALNQFQPHYLHSYPTYLETLAHAQLTGRLAIEPEFISLGSEPVSRAARTLIQQAFPTAEISETYGATECLVMANHCVCGGLHVNEDLCILEPVDRHGHPVPVGSPSDKVYVTNLLNRAQPLLRYELNDSITVLSEECPCGSPMPLIRVEGRSDDTFFFADATGAYHAHPPIPFESLFLNVAGLAQYQLVHETQNHVLLRFVPALGAPVGEVQEHLACRFRAYLAKNHLADVVSLSIQPVPAIEREPGGHKLRQIYSKVPRPSLPFVRPAEPLAAAV